MQTRYSVWEIRDENDKKSLVQNCLITTSRYPMLSIFRKSIRMYDRNEVVFKETKYWTSDVSTTIWWIFMSVTMERKFIDISQKLILNQKNEIFDISTIEWNTIPRKRTLLPHDRAMKAVKAKIHFYSDSVLCLSKIHEHPQSMQHWEGKVKWIMDSYEYRELNGIDGETVEFEWNIFSGHRILELLRQI